MSVPTHHHMQKLHPCRYALALLLTLGLGASLRAQAVTPSGASTEQQAQAAAETPVVLNAFTVDTSTDVGYVAVNSLAGGRNNTPLAITPTTVSALTAEFIDDLQLTNATDALKWTMNAIPQNLTPNVGSGNEFNSWAVNLRGAGSGPQGGTAPTVNYFPIYAIKDFFNVDRFELNLGPNSILFGVDRESTRLNSSHLGISYAVFCLKKNKTHLSGFCGTAASRSSSRRCARGGFG